MNRPKDVNWLEMDLGCATSEYAYLNEDSEFECVANVKMTNHGAIVSIIDGFTLTAEELDTVESALQGLRLILVNTYCSVPEIEPSLRESRIRVDNLLKRIKQWQQQ